MKRLWNNMADWWRHEPLVLVVAIILTTSVATIAVKLCLL